MKSFFQENLEMHISRYDSDWWKPEYDDVIFDFIKDESLNIMFIWCEKDHLGFRTNEPPIFEEITIDSVFAYFTKIPLQDGETFDYSDLPSFVGSGKVMGNHLKGLLSQMNLNFIPNFIKDKSWPVNAKKDFLV